MEPTPIEEGLRAVRHGSIVSWQCPNPHCKRPASQTYGFLQSKTAGFELVCPGAQFSVSGFNPCTRRVTVGEIMEAIGEPFRGPRRDPHAAIPQGDR